MATLIPYPNREENFPELALLIPRVFDTIRIFDAPTQETLVLVQKDLLPLHVKCTLPQKGYVTNAGYKIDLQVKHLVNYEDKSAVWIGMIDEMLSFGDSGLMKHIIGTISLYYSPNGKFQDGYIILFNQPS